MTNRDVTMACNSVDDFRERARMWLAEAMPKLGGEAPLSNRADEATWQRARELQRRLFDGGFAGICFPREYGGLGLNFSFQQAFNEEAIGYEMPVVLNIPSLTICAPTLLDTAGEELKRKYISAALRGDEVLCQLLSEPGGGSDLAGVITRAERRADKWILNGAKTWSSSAFAADHGLCLARTNWDVPKHEGLTMFLVPLKHPNLTLRRIKQVNGSEEFCEEFFDDLDLGDDYVVGEVNKGWEVASRQLFHERRAVAKGSEFANSAAEEQGESGRTDLVEVMNTFGRGDDVGARRLAGRAITHHMVGKALGESIFHGVAMGQLPPAAGSISRLFYGLAENIGVDAALELAGPAGVIGDGPTIAAIGKKYLSRQVICIGGGTTEIARNIIAERVLGFPREFAADRGVPFREVRRRRSES